jgi:hypothetical protein
MATRISDEIEMRYSGLIHGRITKRMETWLTTVYRLKLNIDSARRAMSGAAQRLRLSWKGSRLAGC